jgi:two-component system cell cycle sensor histidine kinase/response regulator CckA
MADCALTQKKRSTFVLKICEAVSKSSNMNEIMDDVVSCLMEYIGVDAACLYLTHGDSCTLAWAFGLGKELAENRDIRSLRRTSSSAMRTLRDRTITHAIPGAKTPTSYAARLGAVGLDYIVWIPVEARGQALGALALARRKDSDDFCQEHDDLLLAVGRQLGMAVVTVSNADLITRLQNAEAKQRDLYEEMPTMYVALDSDRVIIDCNTSVGDILGYAVDELVGQPIDTLLPGFDGNLSASEERQAASGGRITFEQTIGGKEGAEHDVVVFWKRLGHDGEESGSILILEDVTEKNRLESENLYKSLLVDNSTDTMFVRLIEEGTMLYANEASWTSRGYSREEFMQLLPEDLSPPEFQRNDRLGRLYAEFIEKGGYHITAPQLRKDGGIMEMEVTSTRLVHRGHDLATVIMRDVTERNDLQREIARIQRIDSLGRLAAGLAHDFNNMLVGVMGHASLLKAQSVPGTQSFKSTDVIERTASQAAEIVSRLMVFAGADKPKLEDVDPNEITDHVVSLLSGTLPPNIEVQMVTPKDTPHILADRAQIMQCALNLCMNACEAMPDGGMLHVKTFRQDLKEPHEVGMAGSVLPEGLYAGITVRDTGVGMDEATLHKIFEPYFTTKTTNEGHGFGLSTTYGIVRRHGGHISVRSAPGEGARFTMYFPANDAQQVSKEQAPRELPQMTGTVLVVEDDDTVRDFLNIALTRAGYTVILAPDGQEGIEEFRAHNDEIGVAIVDMVMPGMSGYEVCEQLQRLDPNVKILISSGYSDADQHVDHACGYLRKPYRLRELLAAVGDAIGNTE